MIVEGRDEAYVNIWVKWEEQQGMFNQLALGAATSAGNTLVVLISFLILLLLLKKFAWKPVTEMMEKRSETIANDLDNAKNAKEEASRLATEQQNKLADMQKESAIIIEQAQTNAAKIEKDLLEETKQSIAQMKKQAKMDVEFERQRALDEAKSEISQLSLQIAEKLIGKEIDGQTHAQLVDEFIERLADSNETE
ncbi:F0F1 ATP synthase subunit B [Desemzia sp. FAM 24101]|uniref:F0F1 ATP synthase subunit B n=2 Tax=Desemzia TaxID=82800 RepID=UPI00389113C7